MADAAALAGSDALAPVRLKAWAALGEWIKWRALRQRGVHIPNLLQIYWAVTSSHSGSKHKAAEFVLSPRFTENYGVHPTHQPMGVVPQPGAGDDINFYHLTSVAFVLGDPTLMLIHHFYPIPHFKGLGW